MRIRLIAANLTVLSALVLTILLVSPTGAQRAEEPDAEQEILCNEQDPQDFLIRANWQVSRGMEPSEIRDRRAIHQKAIRYRTENYGHFPGFGGPELNANPPMHYARGLRLFERPIRLHEKIIPAARCAEQEVRRSCGDDYTPQRLSGIRDRNTYHNGEVSNHVYGIAIDLDPQQNTCCNCVKQWREHPLCQARPDSIFDRMVMPECWVTAFERYGFYWLGHDRLMDTMHFEFLGDPDHILRSSGPPPHMSR